MSEDLGGIRCVFVRGRARARDNFTRLLETTWTKLVYTDSYFHLDANLWGANMSHSKSFFWGSRKIYF